MRMQQCERSSGGRMTKWRGQVASMAPGLISVSTLALTAGLASAQTTIDSALSTPQTITVDEDVAITATGSVALVARDSEQAIEIDVADYSSDLRNAGALSYRGGTASSVASGVSLTGGLSGTVTNEGTIALEVSEYDDVILRGIAAARDVSGSILNTGEIDVDAISSDYNGEATGVFVGGELTGKVLNDGVIRLEARSVTESAFARGIHIDGSMGAMASVENNGTIEALAATFTDSIAYARGIEIESGVLEDAQVLNNGVIDVEARSVSYTAYATGIEVEGDLDGTLRNSGSITATAVGSNTDADEINAHGIDVEGALTGLLLNEGAIEVVTESLSEQYSAEAVGVAIDNDVEEGGLLSNTGTILASTLVVEGSSEADAKGIWVADLDGTLLNDGTIQVTAVTRDGDDIEAYVDGILADDVGENGSLINNGEVHVSASATSTNATGELYISAWGIGVEDVDGTVTNAGTITLDVRAEGSADSGHYITAYGIYANDVAGRIENSGTISVTATAAGTSSGSSLYITAYGVDAGTIDGTVTNSGSISVAAKAEGSAYTGLSVYAYGIDTGSINGTLDNSGSIDVSATASGTSTGESLYVSAYGMYLSTVDGAFTNSGTISVAGSAEGSAYSWISAWAYGLDASDISGSIDNTRLIEVTADASGTAGSRSLYAEAYGIEVSTVTGAIANSGSIDVSSTAEGSATNGHYAEAYGIETSDVSGSIDNSGTIDVAVSVTGTAATGSLYASAFGIESGNVAGSVTNSGSISVSAVAEESGVVGAANAYGINVADVAGSGSISNTGRIEVSARADGGSSSAAYGIAAQTLDGTLFNSGTVIARAVNGGEAYALKVDGGTGMATLQTSSFFIGALSLGNTELTVVSVEGSGSVLWTFDDLPETVNLDQMGGPTLFRQGNMIASVDPANVPVSGQVASEAASLGHGTVNALMSGMSSPGAAVTRADTSPVTVSTSEAASGDGTVFVQTGFLSHDLTDARGRPVEMSLSSLSAGFVGTLANGLGFGATLSGLSSTGSVRTGSGRDVVDSSGAVLGLYGRTSLGGAALSFGASLGAMSNDNLRSANDNTAANGLALLRGSYDSRFVSPSLELSYLVQSGSATFRPYVGYRYTRLSVDGFTEAGGLGATFGDRSVTISDVTLGVDVETALGGGTLTGSLEVLNRRARDSDMETVLFGIDGSVSGAATDLTAVELGVGYGVALGRGRLDIGGSALIGNDEATGFGVTAGYRISF